jgi:hypothetical protein
MDLNMLFLPLIAFVKSQGNLRSGWRHFVDSKGCRHLLWPLISALVSVLIGESLINGIYFRELEIFPGRWLALVGNVLILYCCIELIFALTGRILSALAIILPLYGLFIAGDILKLKCFDNPVRLTDVQYLSDMRVMAKSYLNPATILAILFICILLLVLNVWAWRRKSALSPFKPRIYFGAFAAAILFSSFFFPSNYEARTWLNRHGIELPESWQFEPRTSSRLNGMLVELAMSAVDPSFSKPENYSRSEIARIANPYTKRPESNSAPVGPPPNIIMLVIESFMDPQDLGVHFTSDPIPTFHAISGKNSSGRVVVPVFGGTSANTEFELLTGLSMYFLPDGSCPYRQYLNQDIPALPRLLHQYGYRSTAIPADPPYLFNHKAVYRHLGFDQWSFPETNPEIPRSPDDEYVADEALADIIISESRTNSPSFIFAFTGGTHFPWEYSDYNNSPLDIAGTYPGLNRSELKTYINALKVADAALNKLIAYFEKVDQKTVILVMGDHLPALTGVYDATGFFNGSGMEKTQKRYQTPISFWSNFPMPKQDFVCSANFIPTLLLQRLGLPPAGIFALTSDLYRHFPVFSKYVQTSDGKCFAPQSPDLPLQNLAIDYHLINYDLLIGKQYAVEMPGWEWGKIGDATPFPNRK